jgi:hypothetical protein
MLTPRHKAKRLSQARAALALPQPNVAASDQAQAFNRRIEAAEAARRPHCKSGRWFAVAAPPKVADTAGPVKTSGTPLAARNGCRGGRHHQHDHP